MRVWVSRRSPIIAMKVQLVDDGIPVGRPFAWPTVLPADTAADPSPKYMFVSAIARLSLGEAVDIGRNFLVRLIE